MHGEKGAGGRRLCTGPALRDLISGVRSTMDGSAAIIWGFTEGLIPGCVRGRTLTWTRTKISDGQENL